jgi:hypothetical protein
MNVLTTKNKKKVNGNLIICNKISPSTTVLGLQQGKPAPKQLTYHHSEKIMVRWATNLQFNMTSSQ